MSRVLETVLTGRNLLSPVLASAGRDVVAFNSTVAGANEKAAAGSAASARAQQAAAGTSAAASGKAATASATGAATQSGAADKIAASNVKASTSASASAQQQMRAHTQAAQSATLNARIQETANRSLAASNGLLGTSLTPLTAGLGGTALALGYAGYRGMEFGTAMSQVQAASQETGATLGAMRDAAIDAGAKTQYSAVEAAQGITEMSKAGVEAKDILGGGLTGALNLAAAGQISVAEAAETGATALSVFGLKGDQMSHVADLLAAGAGKAQGSVGDLSAALNQSALVANQAGLSVEDTAGALAMFASNGLIGSDAGTSFKTMLQALTPNSEKAARVMGEMGLSAYDAQGNFVGLEAYAGQLQTALAGLSEEQRNSTLETIFGSDAVRAASVLYKEGSAGVAEWATNVNDAGYAQRQAAQLTDNLRGDLERLGGAFDSVMTTVGSGSQGALRELVQMLTGLVNGVGWAIDAFGSLPGPLQTAIVTFGAMAALRGPVSGAFEKMSASVLGWSLANDRATTSGGGFKGALGGLLGMINPVTAGLALATAGLAQYAADSSQVDARMQAATEAGDSFRTTLTAQKGELNDASLAAADLAIEAADLADVFDQLGISAAMAIDAMNGDQGTYDEIIADLEEMDRQALLTNDSWTNLFGVGTRTSMDMVSGKATENADAFRVLAGEVEGVSEVTVSSLGGFGRWVEAQNATTEATAAATAQTEEATQALEDWLETLQGVAEGFVDPLAAYQGLLEEKTTAEREAAEATAASTEDASDSWRDHVDDVTVSLDELADRLAEQITNQENWRTNIGQIAAWAGVDVAQHLALMGEEGVDLVAQMADGSSAEAQRMAALIREDIRLGGMEWTGAMDAEMKNVEAIAAAGGKRSAAGLAYELGIGVDQVAAIAARYGIVLADGINPLLGALGQKTVAVLKRGARPNSGSLDGPGFADGGYTGPGGKHTPAGLVHANEYVEPSESVNYYGTGIFEALHKRRIPREVLAQLPGYANGGFVTAADVPKPRSTAPYGPPISTAADATMQKGFDEVTAWLKANAGGVAGSGAVGGAWSSLWNLVKGQIPQARINSTYRAGDPGYHGRNKAIDFGFGSGPGGAGSAGLASINRLLHDQVGRNLAELIYDGIGDDRPDLKNGRPLTYSAATRAQHANHVHAAVADTGGVMESGTAHLNLSGRPERTLSPQQTETFDRWMTSPAAMPGYGGYGGGGGGTAIDYDQLAAAISKVAGTQIEVDARGQGADVIAKKIERSQRRRERAAGLL